MSAHSIAVVTGGTSGIGYAISKRLVQRGWRVVCTGRSEATGQAAEENLGDSARFLQIDHTRADAHLNVTKHCELLEQQGFGTLRGLVNNVGCRNNDLLESHTAESLTRTFQTNTLSAMLTTSALAPLMSRAGGGSVVNVSSRLALVGMHAVSAYAASKSALHGFTVAAAIELADRHIRVNCVAPGMTKTRLIAEWFSEQKEPEQAERAQRDLVPLGRLGEETDIAAAVAFLMSDDASYITGSTLPIDGGYTAQ